MGIEWNTLIANYLNLDVETGASRGAMLSLIGSQVQNAIENAIGRSMVPVTYGDTGDQPAQWYDGSGKPVLYLSQDPIISVEAVGVYGADLTLRDPLTGTYNDGKAVTWNSSKLMRIDGGVFPCGLTTKVSYTAGYSPDSTDGSALINAGLLWATMIYNEAPRLGLTLSQAGGQQTTYTHAIPDEVKLLLTQFRKPLKWRQT